MTSGQKIAFSLLTTIILVAGFVVTAQSTKLFKIIDDRYYSQTQVKEKNEHLDSVAQSLNSYITNVLTQLEEGENAYVRQDCVRSYMEQNPSEALQQERRDLTAQLFNDIPSLVGIRLVDKNGKSLHYSSYDKDVLKINGSFKTYKNYPDVVKDSGELDFNSIKLNETAPVRKILLDSERNRIIMAVPFNWIGDVYSGSMFFYFNFKDVEQELLNRKVISYGENIKLVSQDFAGGIIINLPNVDQKDFIEPVTDQWRKTTNIKSPEKILEMKDGRFWLMLSNSTCEYASVAGVYISDTFQLPQELIWVIYGCVAITIFLISFLLFSFKRNSEAVIKRRLKKIQYGIIKEYLDNKEKIEWSSVVKQLKTRKDDLSGDIYSSLGVHSKKQKKHLDEFLEKSWAEIFEVLEGTKTAGVTEGTGTTVSSTGAVAGITMEQLRNMLEEVLQETSLNINVANIKSSKVSPASIKTPDDVEELDDVEEIEDAEAVEELDDVEEIEDVEAVEELDDVEEIEEVEEIEDAEAVEELDDVEEIEEVEEIEDAEAVEELDDVEEIEEVEDAEAVEELDDVEEIEEIEDAEAVEELDDVEEIEEIEEVEDANAVTEITPVIPAKVAEGPAMMASPSGPAVFQYIESNETFIRSDLFASTSDVFAEELSLGPEYVIAQVPYVPLDFVVYELPKLAEPIAETESNNIEPIEEVDYVPTVENLTKGTESVEPKDEELLSAIQALTKVTTKVTETIAEPEENLTKGTGINTESVESPVAETPEPQTPVRKKSRLGLLAAASAIINNEISLKESSSDEIEELTSSDDYSMTQFGSDFEPVQDLEIAQESIVEKENGLYEVADNLEYTQVNQDKSFQSLVDSVLK